MSAQSGIAKVEEAMTVVHEGLEEVETRIEIARETVAHITDPLNRAAAERQLHQLEERADALRNHLEEVAQHLMILKVMGASSHN